MSAATNAGARPLAAAAAGPGPGPGATFLNWSAVIAGAIVAAAVSFILLSFGSGIGLAVASPSSTWRDASPALAVAAGLWLVLTSLAAFGLGGYVAGRLREPWGDATPDAVEFRDGVHGLVVWALAVVLGAMLAAAIAKPAGRDDPSAPAASTSRSTAEPLIAFELDELFRSDRAPVDPANDPELRAQAARLIAAGLGRSGLTADNRAALARLVEARTGLAPPEAERRVDQTVARANDAVTRARRSAVVLAFMIACSLLLGIAAAWLAAARGGHDREGAAGHDFWRRWDVDRSFRVR